MKIDITNWKDLPDGSAEMTYDIDDEFKKAYLNATGKKRFTQKGLNDWILDTLRKNCEEELDKLEKIKKNKK